ncbi:HigA family addiction module antitoxin [Undibacterium sp. Ji50W]|uniref:HigA family addiction module antitoxin n=1 Tax=Undibacterium TaxID=401469 RepID=UPI003BEFF604
MSTFKNRMRPIHPGEILLEEYLLPLDMSPHALALKLNVTPGRINEIVKQERGITVDTAMRLARYFGGDAHTWLNLQTAFDLKMAEASHTIHLAEIVPREIANH